MQSTRVIESEQQSFRDKTPPPEVAKRFPRKAKLQLFDNHGRYQEYMALSKITKENKIENEIYSILPEMLCPIITIIRLRSCPIQTMNVPLSHLQGTSNLLPRKSSAFGDEIRAFLDEGEEIALVRRGETFNASCRSAKILVFLPPISNDITPNETLRNLDLTNRVGSFTTPTDIITASAKL